MNSKSQKPSKRHLARAYAVQALYQWYFTQDAIDTLLLDFMTENPVDPKQVDVDYFRTLVTGVVQQHEIIDQHMTPHLRRGISVQNPIELSVLRLAIFELAYRSEVPYAVVLNEAIELTKAFGAEAGHTFVNGVLDKLVPLLRPNEKR